MSRINADMKIWLFDLAHGNLNDSTVLSGFVKYYVLHDMNVHDVVRDIVFNTLTQSWNGYKDRSCLRLPV